MGERVVINRHMASPSCEASPISVEFLVLHYSAASLEETLRIFKDAARKVSAHLVVGRDGEIFELVKCWDGIAHKAWHAGESRFETAEKTWEGFNDFSIGVELVNFNGNILPYSSRQYEALHAVIAHLQSCYPALRNVRRIVGHEHIAAFRGKCDPGWCFDWPGLFKTCYPGQEAPELRAALDSETRAAVEKLAALFSPQERASDRLWGALSCLLEKALSK